MAAGKKITAEEFHETFRRASEEVGRCVVGQEQAVEHLLVALFAGGHVLLTGLPGLGRTLLVKTLARVLGLEYSRLQFTPDLLPTDIVGAEVLEINNAKGERHFRFFKGPVFANLVLADEINRSPARTQSALLELMQERQITVAGKTYPLPKPFTLVATQNTLESEGVWPLGEAQSDRFMLCIEQGYPNSKAEGEILDLTTGLRSFEPEAVAKPEMVIEMQRLAREAPVVPSVKELTMDIVRASRPGEAEYPQELAGQIHLGASPRAAQAILLCAKALALGRGRTHVSRRDVVEIAKPVLAHRIMVDFRAKAQGRTPAQIVERLLQIVEARSTPRVSMWVQEVLK